MDTELLVTENTIKRKMTLEYLANVQSLSIYLLDIIISSMITIFCTMTQDNDLQDKLPIHCHFVHKQPTNVCSMLMLINWKFNRNNP